MKRNIFLAAFVGALVLIGSLYFMQKQISSAPSILALQLQQSVSNEIEFESIAPTASNLRIALDASDLKAARPLVGQLRSFVGTVTDVRSSQGNKKIVLDFSPQRETAMRAYVRQSSYHKFPQMDFLKGQRVLILGRFAPHEGRVEVELLEPTQLKIVR